MDRMRTRSVVARVYVNVCVRVFVVTSRSSTGKQSSKFSTCNTSPFPVVDREVVSGTLWLTGCD